jgi:hypothetical protein
MLSHNTSFIVLVGAGARKSIYVRFAEKIKDLTLKIDYILPGIDP